MGTGGQITILLTLLLVSISLISCKSAAAQFCFEASRVRLQRVDLALEPLAVGAFMFPSHIKLYIGRMPAGL
jgi:hypothetical protein